ncbi:MAG TPA: cache domain-containing protein, partial [Rhizobiaceae bacterium]|nr:cache domain-containing protein [Rhizobiaceae bacterium]
MSTLLSVLTFATLLPFIALGSYIMASWLMEERAKEIDRVSAIAADLARAVDRELRGQIETAQVVASTRVLQNGDISAFAQIAEDAAGKANGHFILIDRNHQQLVNTRTIAGTALPKTANQQSAQWVFENGKTLVGNLTKGAVAQRLLYSVRVPVTVRGDVRYVLSFVPREGAIADVVNQTYRPEGWFASVVDGTGRIIARSFRNTDFYGKQASSDVWEQMKEFSGSLVTRDLEGREAVSAFNGSLLSDWKVIVWAPKALLEEPVWKASRLMLMLAGLALAGSLIVAYFTGRLIAKPTAMLLDAARHLGDGQPVSFAPTVMKEANVVGEAMRE